MIGERGMPEPAKAIDESAEEAPALGKEGVTADVLEMLQVRAGDALSS